MKIWTVHENLDNKERSAKKKAISLEMGRRSEQKYEENVPN